MSSNRALVDSLECYMDDLVDSFENFVKKSLILISVGIGSVVCMLVYLLKVVTDRGDHLTAVNLNSPVRPGPSNVSIPSSVSKGSGTKRSYLMGNEPKVASASTRPLPVSSASSCNERFLRDIGYSCRTPHELMPRPMHRSPSPANRKSIPSLPTCLSRQQLSPHRMCIKTLRRTSCCSMCCDDEIINSML